MGKGSLSGEYLGEYAGITKLNKEGTYKLRSKIISMVLEENYNTWYETALVELIKEGFKLNYLNIKGMDWAELDSYKDIQKAEVIINEKSRAN